MKLVVDNAIPFIQGVLEPFGEVVYKEGAAIAPDDVKDADGLIIRTRTRCDAALLDNSAVRFIATATIGTDHIDLEYCKQRGIHVQNASGCNSGGVMNYVLSAIYGSASRKRIRLEGSTVGIIGVGNVGSRVARALQILGFKVLLCDPPRAEAEGPAQFCDLDYLLRNSDVVTMHVPLLPTTRDMADARFFSKMKLGAIFVNASRGEVVVEADLLQAIPKLGAVILDTWQNEPDISRELLNSVDIATPHIAGYSYQGKLQGTAMAVRSAARFFGIQELYDFFPNPGEEPKDAIKLDLRGKSEGQIASIIQYNYPIFTDDFIFRSDPDRFEFFREHYRYRREFFID
ncbi:MAG: 4-phosphoerythronate dehydrogenase [Bacteroidales bacterium]|nr:4-phosphoerythronate dehydrogenase [Bacteroidales bacterium]